MADITNKPTVGLGGKAVAGIILVILSTVFALQNTGIVRIKFLFWSFSMSRVLLIIGSVVIGTLVGILLGWEIFRRKRG
jgi:uncharacterized integral membrane protein